MPAVPQATLGGLSALELQLEPLVGGHPGEDLESSVSPTWLSGLWDCYQDFNWRPFSRARMSIRRQGNVSRSIAPSPGTLGDSCKGLSAATSPRARFLYLLAIHSGFQTRGPFPARPPHLGSHAASYARTVPRMLPWGPVSHGATRHVLRIGYPFPSQVPGNPRAQRTGLTMLSPAVWPM